LTADEAIAKSRVVRSRRRTLSMELTDEGLLIRAPQFAAKAQIDRFIRQNRSWIEKRLKKLKARQEQLADVVPLTDEELNELKKEASKVIPERAAYYAQIIGVSYGRITIRCQKTRWGSCSRKGNLNFNCLLMLAPPEVLDSVVVHELCHLLEMNHSARFYASVRKAYPEYDRWNRWLKDNGPLLMAKAAD